MDANYNAQYDVNVLASAFNMDKAEFMGHLKLIDSWTIFDNDRFSEIMDGSDAVETVTPEELALMANVKAVLVDKEWFQIYDNNNKFTETYVASGMYWNYFYNVWKTVSSSPFSNAIVFVTNAATVTLPDTFSVTIADKSSGKDAVTLTLKPDDKDTLAPSAVNFTQTDALTKAGVGVHKYGAVLIPKSQFATELTIEATIGGTKYKAGTTITSAAKVGDTVTMTKA